MTNVQPLRRKSLWQQHDMLSQILDATEELLPFVALEDYDSVKAELAENRRAQERLRARAEMVEGVRRG